MTTVAATAEDGEAAPSQSTTRPAVADRVLIAGVDGVVVAFGWFTVLAHVWDIVNGSVTPLLIVWLLTLPAPLWLLHRLREGVEETVDSRPGWLARLPRWQPSRAVLAGFAVTAAVAGALLAVTDRAVWRIGWALSLAAVIGALLALLLSDEDENEVDESAARVSPKRAFRLASWGLLIAVVAGAGFALFSVFTITPSGDDAYYVNRVAWIAQHGVIPDRDTMFGNNHFAPLYSPGIGTFETFAGAVAHTLHLAGPTVDYLLLGPLIGALIPLFLWRAIVGLRLRLPALALFVALAFLVWTGGGGQWFGEMVLRRPWQTKEFFAAAMVPLLFCYAALCVQRRGLRNGALLVAATIASVGFTSTAAGIAPLILVAIGVAGYLTVGTRVVWPVLVSLVYPVACLLAYRFGGASTAFNKTHVAHYKIPYDIWNWFIGTGVIGLAAGLALSAGFLGPQRRAVRTMLGAGCLVTVIALAPGVLDAGGPLLGGAPTAWRVMWVAPLLLLVAGVVSAADSLGARLPGVAARVLAPTVAVALVAAFAVTETPVVKGGYTSFHMNPQWDLPPVMLRAARHLDRIAPPGSVLGGPTGVALAVDLSSTRSYSLDAHDYYGRLISYADPSIRIHDRSQLTGWLGGRVSPTLSPAAAAHKLYNWPVAALCLGRGESGQVRARALLAAGYTAAGADSLCLYFIRSSSSG